MEPVDPPLPSDDPSAPPVSWVGDPLGAPLAPASVDALREVLARHRRRQRVLAGVGMALVLVAGSVAGFAVGQQGRTSTGTQVAAADQPAGPAPVAPNASGPSPAAIAVGGSGASFSSPGSSPATQLLLRNSTDGVRVRLYAQSFLKPACGSDTTCTAPPPACFPSQIVQAEVSDDQVAGQTGSPVFQAPSSSGLDVSGSDVVGTGQPQPILVVVAHAGTDVAQVELSTAYGNDSETPTASWVALAVQLPADWQGSSDSGLPVGTLTALSSSGATISSAPLDPLSAKTLPAGCVPSPPVCKATPATGNTSTTGPTVTTCVCKQVSPTDATSGTATACTTALSLARGQAGSDGSSSSESSGPVSVKGSVGEPPVGATSSAVPTSISRP